MLNFDTDSIETGSTTSSNEKESKESKGKTGIAPLNTDPDIPISKIVEKVDRRYPHQQVCNIYFKCCIIV